MRRALLALLLAVPALVAQAPAPTAAERLAEVALGFARQEAAKLPGAHTFSTAQPPKLPPVRPGALAFEALHLSKRVPLGRFFVVVALKVDGERVGQARVDLEGRWNGQLLRAKGDLARKTELTEAVVEAAPFEGVPPEGALSEVPPGQRLQRAVASGKILTRGDLEAVPLVQSGDPVRVTASREGLTVSLDATARGRGGLGDRVRVEAPGARRPVTAVVTGPGEARLP